MKANRYEVTNRAWQERQREKERVCVRENVKDASRDCDSSQEQASARYLETVLCLSFSLSRYLSFAIILATHTAVKKRPNPHST